MAIKDLIKPKGFTCSKCNQQFPDRKQLGKHIYLEHNDKMAKPKATYLNVDSVKELQYLGKGAYVRLEVRGRLTDRGLAISEIKYV